MSPFHSLPGRNKQPPNCVNFCLNHPDWQHVHMRHNVTDWQHMPMRHNVTDSICPWGTSLTAHAHEAQLHWQHVQMRHNFNDWQHVQMRHNFNDWQHVQMRHNFTDSMCRCGTTSLTACAYEAQLHWQHMHTRHNFTNRQHMHMRHNFTDWWHVHMWHNFTDSICKGNTISSGCLSLLLCSTLFHMFDWYATFKHIKWC